MRNRFPKNVYDPINKKNMPKKPAVRHSFSWKTWIGLCVMSLLTVFGALWILTKDEDPRISEQFEKKRWRREIADPEVPLPSSSSILHTFKSAAVSSDTQVCSDIARDVLRRAGNIFDAAVSCLLCNSVTQTQSMGLLGGFLMTIYQQKEGKSFTIDAQMTSPIEFKLPQNLSDVKEGKLSVAVPGFIKGLWVMHKKHGSVPWSTLVQPVIHLCNDGIIISKHFYDSLQISNISSDPYMRRIFFNEETHSFLKPGLKVKLVKVCKFLEILRDQRSDDIYSGKIGNILVEDFKNAESVIKHKDLRRYQVKVGEAIKFNLTENAQLIVPKTAAILVPAILNILKEFDYKNFSLSSLKNVSATILSHHRIIEAFKHVFAVRPDLGDPDFVKVDDIIDELLSSSYRRRIGMKISDANTFDDFKNYGLKSLSPDDHGTSHISMISQNGDAISVTSSINYYFGSKISGNRSGLIFNNGMDDFSYLERSKNYFDLEETKNNYPEPGKRALSSMSPMIMIDPTSGEVLMVIGSAGGPKIISALSIAILRYLCCTKSVKDIVDAARFHHQLLPDEMEYEFGMIKGIIEGLVAKGHKLKRFQDRGTIINALTKLKNEIQGVSDFRKDWSGVSGY